MGMHYGGREVILEKGETRMDVMTDLTLGQILSLPLGTEIVTIDIGPLGFGLRVANFVVNEGMKRDMTDPSKHTECEHGMDRQSLDETPFGGSVHIVLMPENYAPDPSELLNEVFVKRGVRDGMEGMSPLSADALRTKYPTDWHDGAYDAYMTSYKRGSESRKGR